MMSESIEVPKEVIKLFNIKNRRRKNDKQELLKYVAMDEDNEWYAYCEKPIADADDEIWTSVSNGFYEHLGCGKYNWQNTLTEMPLEDI